MSTLIPNDFSSYELSIDEYRAGVAFTQLQRQVIQNEIAAAAKAKLSLSFDPNNPLCFAQQEAELAGKIGILRYLLDAASQLTLTQSSEN